MNEKIAANLALFQELILLNYPLYTWEYDAELNLIKSNCPEDLFFNIVLFLDMDKDFLKKELSRTRENTLLRNSFGMIWDIDFTLDAENIYRIYIIGPAFLDDISPKAIERGLRKLNISPSNKRLFTEKIKEIPVISLMHFQEYARMLRYCLTGEKLGDSGIHFFVPEAHNQPKNFELNNIGRHGTYAAEVRMLKLIEDGNLDYKNKSQLYRRTGTAGNIGDGDSLRNYKNLTIILTALCARAAIRGGLLPETAFTLSDQYINQLEHADNLRDISAITNIMQDDYVNRVHKCKQEAGQSTQIRACCDYIDFHISEKIPVQKLAEIAGYSPNYLSKIFLKEMGMTIAEYQKQQRIQLAKNMLISPSPSVAEIGESLGFHSQSYFGETFRQCTGMTPAAYRKQHAKIQ